MSHSTSIENFLGKLFQATYVNHLEPILRKIASTDSLLLLSRDTSFGFTNLMLLLESASVDLRLSFVSMLDVEVSLVSKEMRGSRLLQTFISLPNPSIGEALIDRLAGRFTNLSMHPYANYLVRKSTEVSAHHISLNIINELSPSFNIMITHPIANYVLQSIIRRLKMMHLPPHPHIWSILVCRRGELQNHRWGSEVLKTYHTTYGPLC